MSVFRKCAWLMLGLGLVLPFGIQGFAQSVPGKLNKVIIYPGKDDSLEKMKASGVANVQDYGAYWIVEASDTQMQSLKKSRGNKVQAAAYLNKIELANTEIDTTVGAPSVAGSLQQSEADGNKLRIIQFKGPTRGEWLDQVQQAGAEVVSYIPNNAYLVYVNNTADTALKAMTGTNSFIQWIGPYHPAYKLHSSLLKVSGLLKVNVAIYNGAQADQTVAAIAHYAVNGPPKQQIFNHQRVLRMEISAGDVPALAQLPEVLWVEPAMGVQLHDEKQDLIVASQIINTNVPVGASYFNFLNNQIGISVNPQDYPIVDIADTGLDQPISVLPPETLDPRLPVNPAFYVLGNITNASRVAYFEDFIDPNECLTGPHDAIDHGTRVASIVAGYENASNSTDFVNCDTIQTVINQCTVMLPEDVVFCPPFGAPFSMICTQTIVCSQHSGILCTTNIQCFVSPLSDCTDPISGTFSNLCETLEVVVTNEFQRLLEDNGGFQLGLGISPFGRIGISKVFSDQDMFFVDGCSLYDYSELALNAYLQRGRIQNNSWGQTLVVGSNDGVYDVVAQNYDSIVRDALGTGGVSNQLATPLNQELIEVFSAGNSQGIGNDGGIGDILITSPATAKNIISVGATENLRPTDGCTFLSTDSDNAEDVAYFSSFGPTRDGRFKPEIMAPGSSIWGAESSYENGLVCVDPASPLDSRFDLQIAGVLYTCDSGTSFSAPAVSGAIQLLWWYFENRLMNEQGQFLLQPSPAMAKTYLCNAARYLPVTNPQTGAQDTLPSSEQGMGILDLARMFDSVPRVIRDESPTRAIDSPLITTNPVPQQTYFNESGQSYELSGVVSDPTQPFRVTVAWTDAPGSPLVEKQLVNDLDLQVTIGGNSYYGNVFAQDHSITGGVTDHKNNMESVFLPAGQTGAWSVVILASTIAGQGVPNMGAPLNQDFALVVYNGIQSSDVPNLTTNNSPQTAAVLTQFPFAWTNYLSASVYHKPFPSPTAGRGGPQEFFEIPAPTPGSSFSANTFGSNFNTLLSVWKGQVGSLQEVTSNASASNSLQSAVSWSVSDTNNYYLVAEGRSGATGQLILNVQANLPQFGFSVPSLNFGTNYIGSVTAMTVTLTNGTSVAAFISSVSVGGADPGDFTIIGENCSSLFIQPGGMCSITLGFSPTAAGVRNATLLIADSITGSPHTLALTGFGLAQTPLFCPSTTSLSFGPIAIGVSSPAQTITITNCGTADMVISNTSVTGAAAGDYVIGPDACSGQTIIAGATCSFGVTFIPTAAGVRMATLVVNDNAGGPQTFALEGTGTVPAPQICLASGTVSFGNVSVGTTGPVQSLVVSNCGSAQLTISGVNLTGSGAGQFLIVNNSCLGSPIPAGGACTIGLAYAPSVIGQTNATLSIADNAAGSPQTVTLIGNSTGSQPDAQIAKTANAKKFIGTNIFSPPAPLSSQELLQNGTFGKATSYYIRCQNDGNSADSYLVRGGGNVAGVYTVQYLLGSKDGFDITAGVVAGTYQTANLEAGAILGDATMIVLKVTPIKGAPGGTNSIPITFTSSSNLSKSDTVLAAVKVR